ncbi:MAG: hypothetical protein EHM33_00775 [Chloroflexi bacterium]|nr:MAG: hypothetical protein EHM33_00775 [Chloroflexota bacterium]
MSDNNAIAKQIEAEKARREADQNKPKKVTQKQVDEARFVWMAGVFLIDALTAWLIWTLTTYLPYAVIWIFAGAGGLLYSERLKERIGNNAEQGKIGERGVKASALAVVLMALLVGTIWVTKVQYVWLNAVMEVTAVVLFFFHVWQSYQYHSVDDEVVAANEEARSEEENLRQIRGVHRAARYVDTIKNREGVADSYRKDHGAALDAALNMYGVDVQQVRQQNQNQTKNQPPQQPRGTSYSINDLCAASNLSMAQIKSQYSDRDAFGAFASKSFDYISGGNIKRLYVELFGNPQSRQP